MYVCVCGPLQPVENKGLSNGRIWAILGLSTQLNVWMQLNPQLAWEMQIALRQALMHMQCSADVCWRQWPQQVVMTNDFACVFMLISLCLIGSISRNKKESWMSHATATRTEVISEKKKKSVNFSNVRWMSSRCVMWIQFKTVTVPRPFHLRRSHSWEGTSIIRPKNRQLHY